VCNHRNGDCMIWKIKHCLVYQHERIQMPDRIHCTTYHHHPKQQDQFHQADPPAIRISHLRRVCYHNMHAAGINSAQPGSVIAQGFVACHRRAQQPCNGSRPASRKTARNSDRATQARKQPDQRQLERRCSMSHRLLRMQVSRTYASRDLSQAVSADCRLNGPVRSNVVNGTSTYHSNGRL